MCWDCEQRLNRCGEKWAIENGFRGPGRPFKIQAVLKAAPPLGRNRTGFFFSGIGLPGIDIDRLGYFGASVFWRSSVHRWPDGDGIDLGPAYQERFRLFLLGKEPFLANAALSIVISDAALPLEAAYFPNGGRVLRASYHFYTFMVPGILFILSVGGAIPVQLRSACAFHSPKRLVFLSSRVQEIIHSVAIDMVAENETVRKEVLQGLRPRKV